jgi:hypothetical protein
MREIGAKIVQIRLLDADLASNRDVSSATQAGSRMVRAFRGGPPQPNDRESLDNRMTYELTCLPRVTQ